MVWCKATCEIVLKMCDRTAPVNCVTQLVGRIWFCAAFEFAILNFALALPPTHTHVPVTVDVVNIARTSIHLINHNCFRLRASISDNCKAFDIQSSSIRRRLETLQFMGQCLVLRVTEPCDLWCACAAQWRGGSEKKRENQILEDSFRAT